MERTPIFIRSFADRRYGRRVPSAYITQCLARKELRHIVVVGDSNTRSYTRALYYLSVGNDNELTLQTCSDYKIHHHHLSYATYDSPSMFVKRRCSCGGFCTLKYSAEDNNSELGQAKCRSIDNSSELILEGIPQYFLRDPNPNSTHVK